MSQPPKAGGSILDLAGTISGILDTFGKSFLIVGYFPALLFVLIHQLILFPTWLGYPLNIFVSTQTSAAQPAALTEQFINIDTELWTALSTNITTFFLPVFIGLLLLSLNSAIIYLYEGRIRFLRQTLLYPFYRRNIKKCRELYGQVVELKKKYREALVDLDNVDNPPPNLTVQQKADALARAIEAAFENIEQKTLHQELPLREYRVTPTALGNVFAIAEEYPFDRYGIDAVLLWPRLRPLIDKVDPEQAQRLTNQKTVLDLVLNLSLLSGLFALEVGFTLISTFFYQAVTPTITLWIALAVGLAFFWFFYQAGVSATRTLGYFVTTSFDYYRHLVLEQFGLTRPQNIHDEQVIWLKLSAFLKRGEAFYWPESHPAKENTADEYQSVGASEPSKSEEAG